MHLISGRPAGASLPACLFCRIGPFDRFQRKGPPKQTMMMKKKCRTTTKWGIDRSTVPMFVPGPLFPPFPWMVQEESNLPIDAFDDDDDDDDATNCVANSTDSSRTQRGANWQQQQQQRATRS